MAIGEIVRQDDTWIAVDPIVGCAKNCAYCFLKIYGATPKRGEVLATPEEAIDDLLGFRTYRKDSAIMLASETDAFMNEKNIEYYSRFLRIYDERGVRNPVVFVTKCHVPDKFIELVKGLENTKVVFYMSYSGLSRPIEPTTNVNRLRENFVRLHSAGLDVVHYWRPFLPQNSSPEKIAEVIDHAAKYARCTVAAGLKLNPGILSHVSKYWPELLDQPIPYDQVAAVWPEGVRDFLDSYTRTQHPNYPLFWVNSCALAYVLDTPEFNGVFGSTICQQNHCPDIQRQTCVGKLDRHTPTLEDIHEALAKMGIVYSAHLNPERRVIVVEGTLDHGQTIYLRQRLNYAVLPSQGVISGNEWGGPVVGRQDLHLPYTKK